MEDNNFNKFIQEVKKTKLLEQEKSVIKQSVLNFIKENPVRPESSSRLILWSNIFSFNKFNLTNTMAILLILTLMTSGGISFAAEQALPGDIFYPIKIGVNEEARAWFKVSSEAKANWEIERAQKRLEEAEQLASEGSLNTENRAIIEANFRAHSEKVKARIVEFENKENFNAAADVGSNFEISLKAHEKILAQLLEEESDDELKVEINPIKVKVGSEAKILTKSREENENKVSGEVRVGVEAFAQGKLKAAENKVDEVRKFISKIEAELRAEISAQAKARLALAEQAVVDGKAKLEVKLYGDAFVLFQKAIRIAQEAKLLIQAHDELEVNVQINGHRNGDNDSAEVNDAEKDNDNSENSDNNNINVELESESNVNANGNSVDGRGKVKVEVGL